MWIIHRLEGIKIVKYPCSIDTRI